MFKKGSWRVVQNRGILAIHFHREGAWPQIAALHPGSSYFRLTCGACGWGTSVVVLPSFWMMNRLFQGARVQTRWHVEGDDLCLDFTGCIAHLDVTGQIRLPAPEAQSTKARVSVQVASDAALNGFLDERPGEAFKPVMLSSMRLDDQMWDARAALVDEDVVDLPAQGWIGEPRTARRFGLRGGQSRWKPLAPTTEIVLNRELTIAGWVTPSADPNDDNVGLWASSTTVLRDWNYEIVARVP